MARPTKTFEQAKQEIEEKFNYLELLEYNGYIQLSKFLDKEYGVFYGNYTLVKQNKKSHPERSKRNKLYKRKQTNLKRYGVEHAAQNKKIMQKIKKTNLEKYGVAHSLQNKKIYNKVKQTTLKKYGVENPFASEEIKEKIKKTNIERYGVENPFASEEIKEKIKKTNIEKYGVASPQQNKEIQKKVRKTNLDKYGVEYISQNEEIKNKIKETNLKKYGVEYVLQDKNIRKQIKHTNLEKGYYHNINEKSLKDYYNNSELSNKRNYSTVQQNYNTYGDQALNIDHYDEICGKSKVANLWLEQIEEELGYNILKEYPFDPDNKRLKADGYDPKTNTIYEFYGDYWHGNLEVFSANQIHKDKKTTMQELYNITIEREKRIKELGYNLISIWESDF